MLERGEHAADEFAVLLRSWERHLAAGNRSPNTIRSYLEAGRILADWARADPDRPRSYPTLTRDHLQAWLVDEQRRTSPGSTANRYRSVQQLYRWLVDVEQELPVSPFARMEPPAVPEQIMPVQDDDALRKLLAVCQGKQFIQLRDTALIRVLFDVGLRRAECAGLRVEDVDMTQDVVHVIGKGRKPRVVPFGRKAGLALDRYLRARARHRLAQLPAMWLAQKGGLTGRGIGDVLERRSVQAGVPKVKPHSLRHTAVDQWLEAGGSEGDAMRLFGWSSRQMLDRYGAARASERAKAAKKRNSPGDRV
jgi:site-specific recombinase XerD